MVGQFLLQNASDLASGHAPDPNAILGLAMARQQMQQPSAPAQALAVGNSSTPLVTGTVGDKAIHAVSTAKKYLGSWYKWGGSTPQSGFDCSGLVQYAWKQSGVSIPRTTYDQWKVGKAVAPNQIHPGDAIFFKGSDSRGGLPGHVGMALGGGKMVVAPHTGAKVQVQNINAVPGYMGARRYS
jgi:cell wall-associated NlpC family hydrolase